MIHDKTLIEKRFARSLERYHTMAVVQKQIAEQLSRMIQHDNPGKGVEIGSGSGFLTERLIEKYPDAHWIANDITVRSRDFLPAKVEFRAEDGEFMDLPKGLDILATASTVQWFDNLPAFIAKTYGALNKGGILAISTFGRKNFREIENSLDYFSIEQLSEIVLNAGFTLVETKEWTEQMTFANPTEVLRHIKETGVNAINQTQWGKQQLRNFIEQYPNPATLTFHPIIIIAVKKTNTKR